VKALHLAAVALAAAALTGCASQQIGAHQPSLDTVQVLRQANIPNVSVGEFKRAPELPAAHDKSVSVRLSTISSPAAGSFAAYLRESLITELRTAGKYDASAPTVINGQLTLNELNAAGASTGNSKVAARFSVSRGGAVVYDKVITAQHEWSSSFIGAIAIPEAINQYTHMYARLIEQLFGDQEFTGALVTASASRSD
jgi:hypothetical protein